VSLRDIMGAAGLTTWPEVALVVCFLAFVAILVYLFIVRRNDPYEHEAALPLEDGLDQTGQPENEAETIPENGHA